MYFYLISLLLVSWLMCSVPYKTFHTDLLCGLIVRDGWFLTLVLFTGSHGFCRIRLFSVCDIFVDAYLCVRFIDYILKRYFFFFVSGK